MARHRTTQLSIKLVALTGLTSLTINAPAASALALPESVEEMIQAAIATGDPEKVATVVEIAKATNPADAAVIDAMQADFNKEQERKAAEAAAAEEEAIRSAGLFENWTGEGQVGAFRSTGNSSDTGLTAGVGLERVGIKWRHKLNAIADFQRSNGVTTREQFLAAYEANYDVSDRMYVYGLAQWERDRFQGFSSRISASGGVGYRVIEEEDMQLSVKAGPAYRRTSFIGGGSQSNVAALGALDFDWQISETLKLTEDASVFWDPDNTTFVSNTGLEAALGSSLTARFAYIVEHDTNPPAGAVKTDTLTRLTLIYGF